MSTVSESISNENVLDVSAVDLSPLWRTIAIGAGPAGDGVQRPEAKFSRLPFAAASRRLRDGALFE